MPESQGENVAIIYDTSATGYNPIASSNTNLESTHFDLRYGRIGSVQILTDGGAKVNWNFQVTNIPKSMANFGRSILGATMRDDSFASQQWSTVQSGSSAATGSLTGSYITLANACARVGRVTLSWDTGNTGGATAKVLIVIRNMGS